LPKDIFLSLICTTVDRINQLKYLVQTIEEQDYDLSKVQVIIINQSNAKLEKEFLFNLNIKFIKSDKVGLSKARNLGLKYAMGEVIGFPDDDCFYEQGLFKKLHQMAKSGNIKKSSFWQFPIFAIENNKSVGRHWRKKSKNINTLNMYNNIASAGMFIRKEDISHHFAEHLGVGSDYPSCEDLIFFWENIVLKQKNAIYVGIKEKFIRHPENDFIDISKQKNYNNGHIKAWGIIYKQSDFIKKVFLIINVALSFLYHYCSYIYYFFINVRTRKKYHKFVFFHRLRLLLRVL